MVQTRNLVIVRVKLWARTFRSRSILHMAPLASGCIGKATLKHPG